MPERVYAEIETGNGVPRGGVPSDSGRLFRSDNAGKDWKLINSDLQPAGRTAYYDRMGVEPDNPNEAYFLASNFTKTLDGGTTMIDLPREQVPRGDHHDIWFDPSNGDRFVVAHDGGVGITTTRGRTWNRIQLPIAQMYHVTVDNRVPYFVYGNKQDGESAMGPSNAKQEFFGRDVGIWRGEWRSVGGGESGWATPDTVDSNLVWSSASGSGSVGGIVTRFDVRTEIVHSVEVWPQSTKGTPADSVKYRFQWTFPLTISPHDHNTVYVGSQHVHVTTDGGMSWTVISPDLTRNDKSKQGISGGLTPDNIGVEYADVVFAIAESPIAKGEIWAGTNDGLVQLTRDGGKSWTNVTANIPGMPAWMTVSNIEPSRYADGTAYITVDGHQVNNRDPWVYRTTDFGKTWTLIVKGIPKSPLSYAHVIREDPVRKGLLYLGTENALYVSFDDGGEWQPLQNDLPHAPVYWLTVQPHFHDLVVATYGRGFYILDDLTPLEQWTPEITRQVSSASQATRSIPVIAQWPIRSRRWTTSSRGRIRRRARCSTSGSGRARRTAREGQRDDHHRELGGRAGANAQGTGKGWPQPHVLGHAQREDDEGDHSRESAPLGVVRGEGVGRGCAGNNRVRGARAAGHVHGDASSTAARSNRSRS